MAIRVQNKFPDALIVHRLDMATSGIMLMALNKDIHRQLSICFQDRKISKTYIALLDGLVEEESGVIDLPLITDWPNRPKQIVDFEAGKNSLTFYNVIERKINDETTRVELLPQTGRTHQLRVHMQSIGHAIIGDRLYASSSAQDKSSRLLLHATQLSFTHPISAQTIDIKSDSPF